MRVILSLLSLMSTTSGTTVATFGKAGGRTSLSVPVGAFFSIRMETNPTTGYDWHIEGILPDCLVEKKTEYVSKTSGGKAMIGAGGTRVLEYTTSEPCDESLRFRYKRAWEDDSESDPIITVDISVEDARDSL